MNRRIVYPGQIPLDTDLLQSQKNMMIGMGYLMQSILGTGTYFSGLSCQPTAPASMQVAIGPGCVITNSIVDQTPYGSLAADATTPLVKCGINTAATVFTLAAPGTPGQSQNYVIQGAFLEQDTDPVTLPYYNSANPSQPFTGPNGGGTPQNMSRQQIVDLQMKAGTPATTGTQTSPAVDSGWTGLWVITVNAGQTAITSTSIARYAGAPFLANYTSSHHSGGAGQAPKVDLANEVTGVIPYPNLPTMRRIVTADMTLNVATTGNDTTGDGSVGAPFRTPQAAFDAVYRKYDWNGHRCTIQVADGTYVNTAGPTTYVLLISGLPLGMPQGGLSLVGNTGSPGNVSFSAGQGNALGVTSGASLQVSGISIAATSAAGGGFGNGVVVDASASVLLSGCTLGSCGNIQAQAANSGLLTLSGTIVITGTAQRCLATPGTGGEIYAYGATFSFVSATVSSTFAVASNGGVMIFGGNTFVGSVSTQKYQVSLNGIIFTGGAGISYLPGNVAGTSGSGGIYA